jgi:2-iminobutanoate/2-iminopropanoate deaminase
MKRLIAAAVLALVLTPAIAGAAETAVSHFAAGGAPFAGAGGPAFSAAVMAGNTLYVSGVLDSDPATGKMGASAEESAKLVLDGLKRGVESGGLKMDDLVYVQVFTTDLAYYAKFNEIYRTYFSGPLPARAFVGTSQLLNGAHFEALGVAVRSK